jgi:hypothetical protein
MIKASDPSSADGCVSASMDLPEQIGLSIKVCNYKGDSIVLCDHVAVSGRPTGGP